jgi:hypothetical protein
MPYRPFVRMRQSKMDVGLGDLLLAGVLVLVGLNPSPQAENDQYLRIAVVHRVVFASWRWLPTIHRPDRSPRSRQERADRFAGRQSRKGSG